MNITIDLISFFALHAAGSLTDEKYDEALTELDDAVHRSFGREAEPDYVLDGYQILANNRDDSTHPDPLDYFGLELDHGDNRHSEIPLKDFKAILDLAVKDESIFVLHFDGHLVVPVEDEEGYRIDSEPTQSYVEVDILVRLQPTENIVEEEKPVKAEITLATEADYQYLLEILNQADENGEFSDAFGLRRLN